MRIIWDTGVGMEMTSTVKDNCSRARDGSNAHAELGIKM